MATEWFYKQSDEELGPYLFRDMVDMVREERLLPDSLVRPSYMVEWQRADSVVGLFYMARKEPEPLPPVSSEEMDLDNEYADENDLDTFLANSDESESTASALQGQKSERPGWLKRLLSLRDSKIPSVPLDPQREIHVNLHAPVDGSTESATGLEQLEDALSDSDNLNDDVEIGAYSEETWSSTVNAAVERVDARAPKQEQTSPPRQILPTFSFSFRDHPAFRKLLVGCVFILCASLGIYGFVDWMGQGKLYFPFIGYTSPLLFLAYAGCSLLTVLMLGPLLVYIAAPYLRLGYRVGAALVTANITIFFLLNWSEKQNMIFPSRRPTETKLIFPLLGECSPFAYWMYFVDSVVIVAVVAYFAAWWLEAQADEI
ncbi:DUF4339 domain-containing protein [Gimesia benthica]|uniref:DUF4339 domain-containing protein n=1 Tax=Gimesia benthica TaxID=2608982 RepID=A0A6I6AGY1_9PLAN|nr:DUF4339 domain-containing protein [Gimesia benthica]QGQ25627.1 DUF4339 domain-containing protein [Gimesia benthica]